MTDPLAVVYRPAPMSLCIGFHAGKYGRRWTFAQDGDYRYTLTFSCLGWIVDKQWAAGGKLSNVCRYYRTFDELPDALEYLADLMQLPAPADDATL